MDIWDKIFKWLKALLGGKPTMPDIGEIASSVANAVVEEAKKAPDELKDLAINTGKDLLLDLKEPILDLGADFVKGLIMDEGVKLLKLDTVSDEELAAMSSAESLRREEILAANSATLALVAEKEAANQEAAAKVRARIKDAFAGLLKKAGAIGVGILTNGVATGLIAAT